MNQKRLTVLPAIFLATVTVISSLSTYKITPTVGWQSNQATVAASKGTALPSTGLPPGTVETMEPTALIQTQEAALNRSNPPGPTLAPGDIPESPASRYPPVCGSIGIVAAVGLLFIPVIRKKTDS